MMSEKKELQSEPQLQLCGDLPPIHSDEFGEFLAQWHADHNNAGRQPKNLKSGKWVPVEMQEMA
jgi:hypothetical protein